MAITGHKKKTEGKVLREDVERIGFLKHAKYK
jgi:hypothetical protein